MFVPEPQSSGRLEDVEWRIIVTDPDLMGKVIGPRFGPSPIRFKASEPPQEGSRPFSLDHLRIFITPSLKFQEGAGRPSRRYFYFRFIMTYIQHKKKNNTAWADDLVKAKGYLWATPGPYLREGMLIALAKAGGDLFMPEAWEDLVKKGSFKDVEDCPAKPAEVEKVYSRTLSSEYAKALEKAG